MVQSGARWRRMVQGGVGSYMVLWWCRMVHGGAKCGRVENDGVGWCSSLYSVLYSVRHYKQCAAQYTVCVAAGVV